MSAPVEMNGGLYQSLPVVVSVCQVGHVHMTAARALDDPGSCPTCRSELEVPDCGECFRPFTSVRDFEFACMASDGPLHAECCTECRERP